LGRSLHNRDVEPISTIFERNTNKDFNEFINKEYKIQELLEEQERKRRGVMWRSILNLDHVKNLPPLDRASPRIHNYQDKRQFRET
jgi:hypothetical protein